MQEQPLESEEPAPDYTGSLPEKGKIKLRLTLGPALIDLEATPAEIVDVVTKLTQEFGKAKIIGL